LDVPPDLHARLAQQATKFSLAELSRIIGLLLVAQTDLRWTTSPRLTFELALVRGTVPEADPTPAGLAARIERLERLANIPPGKAFAVKKVQSKEEELRVAFTHVFGTSPAIRCVARDEVAGAPVIEDADDVPASKEEALARLRAQLGGEIESAPE